MKLLSDEHNKTKGNSMKSANAYENLEQLFERINNLEEAELYLKWDRSAMMPQGGAKRRAAHISEIRLVIAEMLSNQRVAEWLDEAEEGREGFDEWQIANLREMKRLWLHAASIPFDLTKAFSRACSKTESLWYNARKSGTYADVLPAFSELVMLLREMVEIKSEKFELTKYEVMHDLLEPNGSEKKLDNIFSDLESFLPSFIQKTREHQTQKFNGSKPKRPNGFFKESSQKALGVRLMETINFCV